MRIAEYVVALCIEVWFIGVSHKDHWLSISKSQ